MPAYLNGVMALNISFSVKAARSLAHLAHLARPSSMRPSCSWRSVSAGVPAVSVMALAQHHGASWRKRSRLAKLASLINQ